MHASQLAELGSWVASNANQLIHSTYSQPMLVGSPYWTASKIRLQRWITALKMFEKDFDRDQSTHNPWPALETVIQEILMSELLTRVWSATVLTHDLVHETDELHGLAHSIHVSHIEARNRAVRIMLRGRSSDEAAFDRINGLRRRVERWTDLFLGQLPLHSQTAGFGFEPGRVKDFSEEQPESIGDIDAARHQVLAASLANDLQRDQPIYSANPDLNREIAAGILACFPSDRFDAESLPQSAQSIWIEKSHSETQILVDHLVAFENHA